ncbi:hypothetical protein BC835DRAFT_964849 [Cytidiella melzeri]|nr:hypothetical protein BC835DRAFT_964849 [Cytidiella melzeri]
MSLSTTVHPSPHHVHTTTHLSSLNTLDTTRPLSLALATWSANILNITSIQPSTHLLSSETSVRSIRTTTQTSATQSNFPPSPEQSDCSRTKTFLTSHQQVALACERGRLYGGTNGNSVRGRPWSFPLLNLRCLRSPIPRFHCITFFFSSGLYGRTSLFLTLGCHHTRLFCCLHSWSTTIWASLETLRLSYPETSR